MRTTLLMLAHFALPIALVGFGIFAAIAGEWTSAGVCLFAGVCVGAYKVIE